MRINRRPYARRITDNIQDTETKQTESERNADQDTYLFT